MRYFTFICVLLLIDAISFHLFPGGAEVKVSACSVGDLGSIPGLGRSPGGGHANALQESCLENPDGPRSLVGYSPRGCKESDMTGRLSTAQGRLCGWVLQLRGSCQILNSHVIPRQKHLGSPILWCGWEFLEA